MLVLGSRFLRYVLLGEKLLRALIAYGIEVKEVRVIKDRTTSLSWGFGFVEVLDFESAMQIFSRQSHALMVDQRQVSIEYASPASFLVAYAPGAYTIPGLTEDGSVAYYTYWDQNAYATVAYGPRVKDEMEKRLSSVQPVAVQKAEAGFSNATIEKVLPAADTSSAKLSKTAVTKEQEAKMDQELDAFYDDLKDILGEETTNDATTTSSRVFDVRAVGREAEEAFISVSTLTCLLCDKHFKTLSDLRAHQDKNTAHARNAKDSKKIEKAKLRQQVEKRFIAESKQALKQQQKTKPSTSVGVAPKFGGHQIDLSLAAQPKISADSIGGQMLAKMGWTGGGLGKDGTGIVEPLTVSRRGPDTKLGVGATASDRFGSEEDELDMDIG